MSTLSHSECRFKIGIYVALRIDQCQMDTCCGTKFSRSALSLNADQQHAERNVHDVLHVFEQRRYTGIAKYTRVCRRESEEISDSECEGLLSLAPNPFSCSCRRSLGPRQIPDFLGSSQRSVTDHQRVGKDGVMGGQAYSLMGPCNY